MKILIKFKKNLIMVFGIMSICLIQVGCSNPVDIEKENNIFPISKEIGDYIIDIEYSKMFQDSIITKYYITTKDGSDINEANIFLSVEDKDRNISYGTSSIEVYTNNVSSDKLVVVSECFIAKKKNDFMDISYKLSGQGVRNISDNDKKINIDYTLTQDNTGYSHLHEELYLNEIEFNIESIINFEYGSLIKFNIYDSEKAEYVSENYNLVLKSENYTSIYDITPLIGYEEEPLQGLNSDGHYNNGVKYIGFFQGNLIYNNDEVNTNDMQIYLVNKITGEETLIYSN